MIVLGNRNAFIQILIYDICDVKSHGLTVALGGQSHTGKTYSTLSAKAVTGRRCGIAKRLNIPSVFLQFQGAESIRYSGPDSNLVLFTLLYTLTQ